MARTLRRPGVVMVAVFAGMLLTGCTPTSSGWMAVHLVEGGELNVITSLCERETISQIAVYGHGANPEDGKREGTWAVLAPVPPPDEQVQREYTIFRTPAGWTVREDDLESLADGKEYAVMVGARGAPVGSGESGRRVTDVKFRLQELRALDDGLVLVSGPQGDGEVKTVEEFKEQAKDQCP